MIFRFRFLLLMVFKITSTVGYASKVINQTILPTQSSFQLISVIYKKCAMSSDAYTYCNGDKFDLSAKYYDICTDFQSSIDEKVLPKELYYHGGTFSHQSTTIRCGNDLSYKFHIIKRESKLVLLVERQTWEPGMNCVIQIIDTTSSLEKVRQHALTLCADFGACDTVQSTCQ
jgi:hypothetical protein